MSDFWTNWTYAVRASNPEYLATATNSGNIEAVRAAFRSNRDHTPDYPLTCDGHATGYLVRARVREGMVDLEYRGPSDSPGLGIQHAEAIAQDVTITCPTCGIRKKRAALFMLDATLEAVRDGHGRGRQTVRFR